MPLVRRDGSAFGTLCALDPEPATLTEAHFEVFHLLASLIAFELEASEDQQRRSLEQRTQEQLLREQAARAAAEEAERRTAFLAAASHVLASSLDYATTLQTIAHLAVPTLADLCVVDMAGADGAIQRLAAAVADPHKQTLARTLQERYPVDPARPRGVPTVLRTGRSVLHPEVSEELLAAVALDDEHLRLLRALDFHTTMLVPLTGRERTLGVLTFVRGSAGPAYTERDLRLAEDLAGRCALAVENARLFGAERDARERLHALSRRLVDVQEAERRRIGRELHDELGQSLTGVKLLLDSASRASGRASDAPAQPVANLLADAQHLVAAVMAQVRALSLELRPGVLEDLGLLPALLWHFDRYTQQTGVRVAFQHSGVDHRFPPDVETATYRIVQEALTNVARHAAVPEASVRLWRTDGELCVEIVDQGRGFHAGQSGTPGASAGLTGMRERAALLGGQLDVDSAPGSGTHITAVFPIAPPLASKSLDTLETVALAGKEEASP